MTVFREKFLRRVIAGATTAALVFPPQALTAGESTVAPAPTVSPAPTAAVSPVPTGHLPVERPILDTSAPGSSITTASYVSAPRDVVLQGKGVLRGCVVNSRGLPMPNTVVSLQTGGKEVARVVSDKTGTFQAEGLKGGVYQVASNGHQGVYRFWTPQTAPPAAAEGLSMVSQPVDVVRGQLAPGPGNPFASVGDWIADHPLLTAGAVGAAIAIPIAVNEDSTTTTPPATP